MSTERAVKLVDLGFDAAALAAVATLIGSIWTADPAFIKAFVTSVILAILLMRVANGLSPQRALPQVIARPDPLPDSSPDDVE